MGNEEWTKMLGQQNKISLITFLFLIALISWRRFTSVGVCLPVCVLR